MLQLSERVEQLQASPIREILAVIARPGMISFAGGLPAEDSFTRPDFSGMPTRMLQYGASEGEPALREQICQEMKGLGLQCETGQVLVLSGSQQGIDLVAKLVVDKGSLLALENPTYLAALQVFRFFGARFTTLDPQAPASLHEQAAQTRLCYVIPTFQNPSGYCYTLAERQALAARCEQQELLLFEDDPYRDLVFEACERTPVCSFMREGSWVYQGSFSKSYAPGLRLGFLVCSKNLVTPLTRLKQAADLHSNRVSQYWILQQLQSPQRGERMEQLQNHYRSKRDAFAAILQELLSEHAEWDVPKGGLFFWLRLKRRIDTGALLQRAIERGVAFMPGEPFFHSPDSSGSSFIRLNFSHAAEADTHKGLAILADLLQSR